MWKWRIAPDEHFDGAAHPKGTIEVLSILRGTLRVEADNETATARAGLTVRFAAEVPHRYANAGNATCEFQMVVLEPVG
jgi:mannose-6-phosphate isomerase-like protein (cupin superfamily)